MLRRPLLYLTILSSLTMMLLPSRVIARDLPFTRTQTQQPGTAVPTVAPPCEITIYFIDQTQTFLQGVIGRGGDSLGADAITRDDTLHDGKQQLAGPATHKIEVGSGFANNRLTSNADIIGTVTIDEGTVSTLQLYLMLDAAHKGNLDYGNSWISSATATFEIGFDALQDIVIQRSFSYQRSNGERDSEDNTVQFGMLKGESGTYSFNYGNLQAGTNEQGKAAPSPADKTYAVSQHDNVTTSQNYECKPTEPNVKVSDVQVANISCTTDEAGKPALSLDATFSGEYINQVDRRIGLKADLYIGIKKVASFTSADEQFSYGPISQAFGTFLLPTDTFSKAEIDGAQPIKLRVDVAPVGTITETTLKDNSLTLNYLLQSAYPCLTPTDGNVKRKIFLPTLSMAN